MIKIVVCDDEERDRNLIQRSASRIMDSLGQPYVLEAYGSGLELLEKHPGDMDVLLIDIQMRLMDGLETARAIRKYDDNVKIIFVTSYPQYAYDGYRVRAFSFIVKPIKYSELCTELTAAVNAIVRSRGTDLVIRDGQTSFHISSRDILYLEVQNHNVIFHTAERQISVYAKLADYESKLREKGFFRCHKSFLVNQQHIAAMDATSLTLSDKSSIPLSKHRRREFMEEVADYLGGGHAL